MGMLTAAQGLAALERVVGWGLAAGSGSVDGWSGGLAALGPSALLPTPPLPTPPPALLAAALEVPALLSGGGRAAMAFYRDLVQAQAGICSEVGSGVLPAVGAGGSVEAVPRASVPSPESTSIPISPSHTASLPIWSTMDAPGRVVWATRVASDAAARAAGHDVGLHEPLLAAGVDSLGESCFGREGGSRERAEGMRGGACTAAPNPAALHQNTTSGAVELQRELSVASGLDLSSTLAFDYPSIAELGAAVAAMLPGGGDQGGGSGVGGGAERPEAQEAAAVSDSPPAADGGRGHRRRRLERRKHKERRRERGEAEGGEGEGGEDGQPQPSTNPNAPTLTPGAGLFTVPPLAALVACTDAQLAAVTNVVVGRAGVGEVAFLEAVDLRGAALDAVVSVEPGRVALYADPAGPAKPPLGAGLNVPALVTLRGIAPKSGSARGLARMAAKLRAAADAAGSTHVHYDGDAWTVKVDGF